MQIIIHTESKGAVKEPEESENTEPPRFTEELRGATMVMETGNAHFEGRVVPNDVQVKKK